MQQIMLEVEPIALLGVVGQEAGDAASTQASSGPAMTLVGLAYGAGVDDLRDIEALEDCSGASMLDLQGERGEQDVRSTVRDVDGGIVAVRAVPRAAIHEIRGTPDHSGFSLRSDSG